MKGSTYLLLASLACLPVAAQALSCQALKPDAERRAETAARSAVTASVDQFSCVLTGESKLTVQGRATSSLARGQGYFTVSFFNSSGKRLAQEKSYRLLGQFENLPFSQTFNVPKGASKAVVATVVDTKRADVAGALTLHNLSIKRGLDLSLEAPLDGVSFSGRGTRWILVNQDGQRLRSGSVTVRDINKKTVKQFSLRDTGAKSAIDFGVLPVGYYDVTIDVVSDTGQPATLNHSLAVIPAGIPTEKRIGIVGALSWYGGSAANKARPIRIAKAAGVGSMRDLFSWTQVQGNENGEGKWGRYQETASMLADAGIDVVQVFHDTPAWARAADFPSDKTPPSPERAYEFGRFFASGLGRTVRHVEFWNEQNGSYWPGYPYQYAAALKAFYHGIKSVDPRIGVLIGPAAATPGHFFEDLYKNNVYDFYDIYNQHYYSKIDKFSEWHAARVAKFQAPGNVQKKPAWLTEIGYSLKRDKSGSMTEAEYEQARYLVKTYAQGFSSGYERVFYFLLIEYLEADEHTWGILRDDYSPRPAYVALAVLAKHIAGAPIHGVLRAKGMTSVYFKDKDGSYKAIVWGKGEAKTAGGYGAATSIFGQTLAANGSNLKLGDDPVLLSKIKQLPPGVQPVKIVTRLPDAPRTVRLTGDVYVNGERQFPKENTLFVDVPDGATVEIRGKVVSDDGLGKSGKGSVRCAGGKGVTVKEASPTDVRMGQGEVEEYRCKYTADLSSLGESYLSVAASGDFGRDSFYVGIKQGVADPTRLAREAKEIWPANKCGKWGPNASPNQRLSIEPLSYASGFCSGAIFRSEVNQTGETWVFPFVPLPEGGLGTAKGIKFTVSKAGGMPPPPVKFLVQLMDKQGGIWLVKLNSKQLDEENTTWYGLFNSAKPAAWAKPKSAKLNLTDINRVMIGWGGFGGQKGQTYSYGVRSVNLLVSKGR